VKVPVFILTLLLASAIAVESWVLLEVVALKVQVAQLAALVTRQADGWPAASRSFQSAQNKNQKERSQ